MLDFLYNVLSGVGFNEPIHPPITHMPIGLAVGALLFFLVAVIFKKSKYVITARHVSILAFIFAFPTILLGAFDWIHFYHAALIAPIVIKMILAGVLLAVLGTGIVLGGEFKHRSPVMITLYGVAFIAVLGLGFFGSGLIYGRGVGTPASVPTSSQAPAGKTVFEANCQSCHSNGGNSLAPEYPIKKSPKLGSQTEFLAFIRAPRMRDGTPGDMPAFTEANLSAGDAETLYVYAIEQQWK